MRARAPPAPPPKASKSRGSAAARAAEALFAEYEALAPAGARAAYGACWSVVEKALLEAEDRLVGNAPIETDAAALGGALAAFVTPGPTDLQLAAVPEASRALVVALSDTAAAYERVAHPALDWGTRYRTLNAPTGAFFAGFQLWPGAATDAPNFTLYFGSGSAKNPDRVFVRLELVARRDVALDAAYAERCYEPYNATFFEFAGDERFDAYVSESAYARGALAPSGLRYFFDLGDDGALERVEAAALEAAALWASLVDDPAGAVPPDERPALAERDAALRRVASENSPDNANRALVFGDKFALTKQFLAGAEEARA